MEHNKNNMTGCAVAVQPGSCAIPVVRSTVPADSRYVHPALGESGIVAWNAACWCVDGTEHAHAWEPSFSATSLDLRAAFGRRFAPDRSNKKGQPRVDCPSCLRQSRSGDAKLQRPVALIHPNRRPVLYLAPEDHLGERVLQIALD